MRNKHYDTCKKCRQSRQIYNGWPYCMNHHPQTICPACRKSKGRFLPPGRFCESCQKHGVQLTLPLSFEDKSRVVITGLTGGGDA